MGSKDELSFFVGQRVRFLFSTSFSSRSYPPTRSSNISPSFSFPFQFFAQQLLNFKSWLFFVSSFLKIRFLQVILVFSLKEALYNELFHTLFNSPDFSTSNLFPPFQSWSSKGRKKIFRLSSSTHLFPVLPSCTHPLYYFLPLNLYQNSRHLPCLFSSLPIRYCAALSSLRLCRLVEIPNISLAIDDFSSARSESHLECE